MSDAAAAVKRLDGAEVEALLGQPGVYVVDVRPPVDVFGGRIPGALNMPGELILQRTARFAGATQLIFVSDDGAACADVAAAVAARGLGEVAVLSGGMDAWFDADRPIETISDRNMQF